MPESHDLAPESMSPSSPAAFAVSANEVPQFGTAEYALPPGVEKCRVCSNLISGDYYRVNQQIACPACAAEARNGQPAHSHAAFLRGLMLGAAGAVIGLILYATVAIVTGWTIGYLALAVGWLVGTGIIKGSNGLGGRRYQVAALILTYFAISMAAIPIGIAYSLKHESSHTQQQKPASDNPFPGDAPASAQPQPKPPIHLGAMLGGLLLLGLASPFLEFTGNIGSAAIGLFILFIGLRIAWKLTAARSLQVDGPFANGV